MPPTEDDLHHSLAKVALVAIVEDDVELSPPVEVEKEKEENSEKDEKEKGKATAKVTPSTANITTRSTTKVSVEVSTAFDVMEVGSPFVEILALVVPPSYNNALVL